MLDGLPVEVQFLILSNFESDRCAMLNYALCCKQMFEVAAPMLWKRIILTEKDFHLQSQRPFYFHNKLKLKAKVLNLKCPTKIDRTPNLVLDNNPTGLIFKRRNSDLLSGQDRMAKDLSKLKNKNIPQLTNETRPKLNQFSRDDISRDIYLHQGWASHSSLNFASVASRRCYSSVETKRDQFALMVYGIFVRELSLGVIPSLKKTEVPIDVSLLKQMIKPCPLLQHLNLSGCLHLNDFTVKLIRDTCSHSLQSINLSACPNVSEKALGLLFQGLERLNEIVMDETESFTDRVLELASLKSQSLRRVSINQCHFITDHSITGLCKRHGEQLELLNMSRNRFTHAGLMSVVQCRVIRFLNISFVKQVSDETITLIARYCQSIVTLNIEGCTQVGDAGLLQLAKHCVNLESVNLTFLELVTDDGFTHLSKNCKKLKEVFIGKCARLGNKSVKELATNCPGIERLYAAACHLITDSGFCDFIKYARNLEVLSIPGCTLTDKTIDAARTLSKSLTVAQFSFCDQISSFSIGHLAFSCPKLSIIQLVGCRKVINSYVMRFSQPCPPNLVSRYSGFYCAIRQPNISELGKFWFDTYLKI